MASKRLCPFCAAGHACLRIESRRRQSMLHCRLSHQRELICPRFSRLALKMTASSLFGRKKITRAKRNWSKTGHFEDSFMRPFSTPDLCFSHKFYWWYWKHTSQGQKSRLRFFECEKEKWCRTGKAVNRFYHTPQQTLWRLKENGGGSCFKWAQFATNPITFEHSSVVSTEPQNIIA